MLTKEQIRSMKEFKLSTWAINNKTTIYTLMLVILYGGISSYFSMARESFPEIKETKIYVSAVFPGNTAEDIEKLIVDPLEDQLKTVSNVVEITSTSQEDYGMLIVEFDENISVSEAKQKVKDQVDAETAGEDWPTFNGVKVDPEVFDLSISEEISILNINLTGNYQRKKLKEYAELLQDEIEGLSEIKKVDILGVQNLEVEVAVDVYKMMAANVSFNNISSAISNGNMTVSSGNVIYSDQRRTIRVLGEISTPDELEDFIVKTEDGKAVYLKDIAEIKFKEKEANTYARDYGKPVVMLEVKKRSGKNMVQAVDKIKVMVAHFKKDVFPSGVKVSLTNDQSEKTIGQVDDLVNNIIFGVLLVVGVLMFFLGFKNALFVGYAIPMSMFMSLMILDALGYTMNTMILFGLIMGLGMLVDNGIVVVENIYRLMDEEGMDKVTAAKKGIGEIAYPIIISTATTVAAFIPLGMWPGVMGQFMIYFPVTLSVVLGSSLFVAIFFNSVLVSQYMKTEEKAMSKKRIISMTVLMSLIGLFIFLIGGPYRGLGTVLWITSLLIWMYRLFLRRWVVSFQENFLPKLELTYERFIERILKGKYALLLAIGTVVLLFLSFVFFGMSVGSQRTKVEFFPDNTPNQIMVYIEYPQGTDIEKTNRTTKILEKKVYEISNQPKYTKNGHNFLVESAISQVGQGAGNPNVDGGSSAEMPHKSKITLSMRKYKERNGLDSEALRQEIQEKLGDYPGVLISVEKEAVGPPAGSPINIELEGKDYAELIETAERMRDYINKKNIAGIDKLKIDVNKDKPGMVVEIDRQKAGELGVSAAQIGAQLRNAVFGTKAGVYKEGGDNFDIYIRFDQNSRYDIDALFNQKLTFKNEKGQSFVIPLSSLVSRKNQSGFNAIKHKETKRVVTIYSALAPGYTDAAAVVRNVQSEMKNFKRLPLDVKIDYTGQIEEQNKQMAFLMGAFFAGLGLIFFILIFQFNSISKPAIIMLAIFLSFIGVFGGLIITGAPFVIMMTMMGIISLAGVVVNNGVVLLDYTQLLMDRKKVELNLQPKDFLSNDQLISVIMKAGKSRLRPVLLTAITTILGLIPLSTGFNINFFTFLSNFNPNIYVGGDNVIFWGPLANTVIYGLLVATFLTLVVVPVLFLLVMKLKMWLRTKREII